ncbi:MAG: DUF333 domain-containing protein [Anaerolineae bacterium]|nr:DUF333 domain-containing protein [Anaerolineae bacterium]
MNRRILGVIVIAVLLLLTACGGRKSVTPQAGMPNPASVYCEEHDGTLEIREDESGGQVGICVFADRSECEEWAYFRGECAPGDSLGAK